MIDGELYVDPPGIVIVMVSVWRGPWEMDKEEVKSMRRRGDIDISNGSKSNVTVCSGSPSATKRYDDWKEKGRGSVRS